MNHEPHLIISGYADAQTAGIHLFAFGADGILTEKAKAAGIENPSFVVVHPNGRWLYTVSEGAAGQVWALQIDPTRRLLTRVNSQPSGGDAPCQITMDATGWWLVVANYSSGSVGVVPITPDGSLGAMADHVQHQGSSVHPERQTGPYAHSTIFTPDQKFVIAADLGTDTLYVYAFDGTTGRLTPHGETRTRAGAGPRHTVWHPNGRVLYVANELDNTVGVYGYDAAQRILQAQQVIATLPKDAPATTTADIHITHKGDYLYVSNRGHDSIATFTVAEDGALTLAAIQPCGGQEPRNFALSPDERFLVVANQKGNSVVVLPTRGDAGIGEAVAQLEIPSPSWVGWL